MKPFKRKRLPIFYRRPRKHLLRGLVETLGTRLWEGGEEGALMRVSIAAGQRRRVCPSRVSSTFAATLGGFFGHHFNCSSHISDAEGLILVGLISLIFSSFCIKIFVLVIRPVISRPDFLLFCY